MPRQLSLVAAIGLCLGLIACDDGNTDPMIDLDMQVPDVYVPPVVDMRVDRAIGEAGMLLGQIGDPCNSTSQCEQPYCIPYVQQEIDVCTETCGSDGDCPADWACRILANSGADAVAVCTPPQSRVCRPCVNDSGCPGGHCYILDGQSVCGFDCESDDDCTTGYACADVEGRMTCTPSTGSCTCNDDSAGDERLCTRENEAGTCIGRETCDPEAGWVGCNAQTPAAEVCNQIDDDCNGFTDDIDGLGEVCERSVEVDGETIACAGRLVCTLEDEAPQCTAPAPMAEQCNFLDDDCDGATDEGFELRGQVCVVGDGACRRVGVNACSGDGLEVVCDVVPGDPIDELCNSVDDDCDGLIDEAFVGLNEPCFAGEGACQRAGTLRCDDDGVGAVCTAVAQEPSDETCDGIDNDCDGSIDEGFDGLFEPCSAGVGACLRQGFRVCTEDGAGVACNAAGAEPADEVCNGIDDDCDGTADEGYPGVNRPCAVGIGQCRGAGVTVCSADGAEVVCDAELTPPSDEVCNGLDDDCDETTDEGFDGLNTACTVGVGACLRSGVRQCSADGSEVACDVAPGMPAEETCNRLDDDCDGTTDEGYDGVGVPCTVGRGICQRSGIGQCGPDGDTVVCDATAGDPADEQCNGLDDDCDGTTDEGYDGINTACTVGVGVCAATGVRRCSPDGSAVACDATPGMAGNEICNGLDDDCDGTTDEGYDGVGQPCSVGEGLCRRAGVTACAVDGQSVVCGAQPGRAAAELCDGLDNDCDGISDEGFQGIGQPCSAGQGVCLRQGVRICAADGESVECNAAAGQAGEDICNGLDDDCDGRSDEDYGDLNRACTVGQGVCRRVGVRVCAADGSATVCDEAPGDASPELCNGLDDDCDGTTDEGYAGLGQQCEAGQGLCRRSGVRVCAGDGASVVCDAVPGPAAPAETCDYQDDNCNGQVDEGFVDAQGRYVQVTHCGACGTDCTALWDPNPGAFGVVPRCAVGAVAQCGYDCLPGFIDADGRPGNGCELQADPDAVYVATREDGGVAAADCGTLDRPCDGIGRGIGRAVALNRIRVRVAEGVYRESVTLVEGVDVLGGHDPVSWVRDAVFNVTIINGASPAGGHRTTVRAEGITQPTVFDGFVVNGESVLQEANSYAIYIRDSNSALSITNNRIFAGDGGRGLDGSAGQSGLSGTNGAVGRQAFSAVGDPFAPPIPPCGPNPGASGGARVCGAVNVDGGTGGAGRCPAIEQQEGSGARGQGPNGGAGGPGAWGFEANDGNTCTVSQSGPADAGPGAVGRAGSDGDGGQGGAGGVGQAAAHWQGLHGQTGGAAAPGSGGGGGGAAAGVDVNWAQPPNNIFFPAHDIGASGGGGGSGGCQGQAGGGGTAGGGSFGIYVSFSGGGPANAAAFPTLEGNEIARGLGGNGGVGGTGGGGGEGGLGGSGGARGDPDVMIMGFCSLAGADGAAGGRGGHGGGGGGGQGGVSYDIFVANDNGRRPADYSVQNVFVLPGDEATHGLGGAGGNSSNTDIGLGARGGDGISGNVGAVP